MICEDQLKVDIRTYSSIYNGVLDFGYGAVEVVRTRCHFGGSRYWFRCPRCQDRKAILYVLRGAVMCRTCGNLRYRMELVTSDHRKVLQLVKKFQKLGVSSASLTGPVPEKPKGMHWATYFRIHRRIRDLQAQRVAVVILFLERNNDEQ